MKKSEEEIQERINRETGACNSRDAETLVSLFHKESGSSSSIQGCSTTEID